LSFSSVCLGFLEKSFYQKKSILTQKWKAIRISFSQNLFFSKTRR